jgi:tetratricopeptide (TPR) repeat protein
MSQSNLRHWLLALSFIMPCLAILPNAAFAADDTVLNEARAFIKSGNHKAAYELLLPLESERSGAVEFDMLLGVAAIEGGENSRGIFALERVLAQEPNNIEARAMIAKGYYKAGEAENAKSEFNNVLSQNPNAEITKLIENNMLAIDRATGQATTFAAYLDFGIGHDSNINSATTADAVNISISGSPLIPFSLTTDSIEQSSNFVSVAGGISVKVPLTKKVSAFGSLAGTSKINWNNEQFDPSSIDYSLGVNIRDTIDNYTLALQGGSFSINGDTFREAVGLSGQWQRNVDDHNQVSVFTQLSKLDYPNNEVRDAKRYVLGGAWSHAFDGDKAKVTYLSMYAGKEDTDDNDVDFLGHDLFGVRAGGQMAIHYKLVAFANASYEFRDYDGQDPTFLIAREDNQFDLNLGLRYLPGYNFTIKPQISYIDNYSNNDLYEFDRWIVSINVRKDFNW